MTKQLLTPPSEASEAPFQEVIYNSIDALDQQLREVSIKIHDNPELCYKEFIACETLTSFIRQHGFDVTNNAYGLETSFSSEFGSGGRLITFCAEYDALPEIGHACGHNLIATASAAAFLGVAAALKMSGLPGRVRLLGCPAEEGGGGKVRLIKAGAFADTDAALMVHPTQGTQGMAWNVAYGSCLAGTAFDAHFEGEAAHAGAIPWEGVNALDAATLAYTAVGLLRQQCRPTDRINIVLNRDSRTGCGVITDKASLEFGIRCATLKEVERLKERVRNCVAGASLATGCKFEYRNEMETYAELRPNETLCAEFTQAMRQLGTEFSCDLEHKDVKGYGTDMGNVSYECPSLHATFVIPTEPGQATHSAGFAAAAATMVSHRVTLTTAKGMALAGFKVLAENRVADAAWEDFRRDEKRR